MAGVNVVGGTFPPYHRSRGRGGGGQRNGGGGQRDGGTIDSTTGPLWSYVWTHHRNLVCKERPMR